MKSQVMQRTMVVALVMVGAIGVALMAQDQRPSGGAGERGDRGRGRNGQQWDPAQMAERMNARMREDLKVNDEEWAVLSPKLTRLTTAQRNLRGGFGGGLGGGRRGGPGGPGGAAGGEAPAPQPQADQNPIAKATTDLRETLAKEDATAEALAEKLGALRAARKAAEAELAAARKDLREVLTQRQEATLVLSGLLD